MKKKISTKKILLYGLLSVILILIIISLLPGKTSPILNQNGKELKDSVSVMEKVTIGGVDQWIVTRGKSKDNPIILLLSGGPGGTEMGRFLKFNKELEDHFIVVNWEQRGSGKSYPSIKEKEKMTLDQYVSDIDELTNYLKEKYEKDKIYLLGHSWGTIIGTLAAQRYPEQFHAYIGAAQMIDIIKTDKYIYQFVLNAARNNGDQKLVDELVENGEPPYSGDKVLNEYKPVLTNYRGYYRKENSYTENNSGWYNPMSFLWISEYNLIDKVNALRGMINTFNIMYPQIQSINFNEQVTKLEVPVYYLIGRHDYTSKFIENYFNKLDAPYKELIYFENSGHGEIWSEPNKFIDIMVNKVLNK